MKKQRVLKGLLAVSTVAAMFSAFGVQAQTVGYVIPSANDLAQIQYDNRQNLSGKTTIDGTVGNSNSQGMEMRPNADMRGASGTRGTTQSGMSSMGAQSSSSGMTGTTTRDGTVGNTNSQGMESRTNGSTNGMSGTSSMTGTQGSTTKMPSQSGSVSTTGSTPTNNGR
jgi:putative membrane protein